MEIDLSKFADVLDKPGTGIGKDGALNAISGPKLGEQGLQDVSTDETDQADATSSAQNDDVDSDEEKVPKSRFRKTREELIELRHRDELRDEQMRRLEAELEAVRSSRSSTSEGGMPDWWAQQWGDSDESKKAYEVYSKSLTESARQMREEIRKEEQAERQQRQQVEEEVSSTFDTQLEDLEENLGKSLTDKQAAQLLEIVEEYSPTDEDGRFESFISLEKAYEIFDLRQRGNRGSKDRLARISGASSQGEAANAGSNAPNAPQWGDWRKRFGN